jgi:serine/threonine protein kinase
MDESSQDAAQTSAVPDRSGTLIAEKYRVLRALGQGATGTVYLCEHTALEKQVAIKLLHPELVGNPGLAARFQREAQTAARLDHPNSVHVMDFGQAPDGEHYLAMEYVHGRDLGQVLIDDWPLSDERVVAIMTQVLSALSAAHALGIVHRDLKPENILVRAGDEPGIAEQVKVCDFGIAQLSPGRLAHSPFRNSKQSSIRVTGDGTVVGTPAYMSPEQARAEVLDARSDLYSAGVVLFQLLTRTLPFVAETPMGVAVLHCTTPPPPPSGFGPVDAALEAVCLKALSKTREARYQSAREMRDAVQAALTYTRPSRMLARRPGQALVRSRTLLERASTAALPSVAPSERIVQARSSGGSKRRTTSLLLVTLGCSLFAVAAAPRFLPTRGEPASEPTGQPSAPNAAPSLDLASNTFAAPSGAASAQDIATNAHAQAPEPEGNTLPDSEARPVSVLALATPARPAARRAALQRSHMKLETNSAALDQAYASDAPRGDLAQMLSEAGLPTKPSNTAQASEASDEVAVAAAPAVGGTESETQLDESTSTASPSGEPASAIAPTLASAAPSATALPSAAALTSTTTSSTTSNTLEPAPPSAATVAPEPSAAKTLDFGNARVVIGATQGHAGVSRASIRGALNQGALDRCYRDALRAGGLADGPIDAELSINTNMSGQIVKAAVQGGQLTKALRECIAQVARSSRVREVDTGEAQADVSLTFQPR